MRKYYKVIIPIVLVCVVTLIVVIIHNNNSEKSFTGSEGVSNSNLNEPRIDDEKVKLGDTINGYLFDSKDVNFDNTDSGLLSTNVGDAIDELYQHATDYSEIKNQIGNSSLSTTSQTITGAINEIKSNLTSKQLGQKSTLADLKSALVVEAESIKTIGYEFVSFVSGFTENGFINGLTYKGLIQIVSYGTNNGSSYIFFTIVFNGVSNSCIVPVNVVYNNGSWKIDGIALNSDKQSIIEDAGYHNSIYRGKDVTSYLNDGTLYTRISSGKFTDLYVGDYFTKSITIGGNTTTVTWRIAGFDMYYGKGDTCGDGTACKVHHAVIVPGTNLTLAQMNASDTTGVTDWTLGAYAGSKMYNETLPTIETAIKNAFGSSHILKYRALLSNATNTSATNRCPGTTGASSGWAWYDAYVNLMNMVQVTGNIGFSSSAFDTGADNIQFPLFRLKPQFVNNQRSWYWVRDVSTSASFAQVSSYGFSNYGGASSPGGGVRPYFYID